jgi:hypothetical protein
MRNERRRQNRERQAAEMNTLQECAETGFEQMAPILDDAINQLGARDRAAIVLRFFEHRDLRAIGMALGSNENAAQKCVSRAVEKLRGHFVRRGIVASSTAIASVIAANAVQAAPAGLASAVTTASLVGAAGSSSFGLTSTLIKTMLMKKTTLIISAAILITAVVSISTVGIKHARANAPVTAASLREGLVLDMTFNKDETGGGKITDNSGKGNNGRASGIRWIADDRRGGAYEFTADGDEIVVSNNGSLNPKQMTLAAWIKTKTGDHYWRRIFDKSYGQGFALSLAGDWQQWKSYGQLCMEVGPGTHVAMTKKRVDDGQWHQVVSTFDGTVETLYVDGQPQARMHWDKPGQVGITDFNLVIGCNRSNLAKEEDDLGVSFRGLIAEPMMWNRALSTNEIAFLYQSQR